MQRDSGEQSQCFVLGLQTQGRARQREINGEGWTVGGLMGSKISSFISSIKHPHPSPPPPNTTRTTATAQQNRQTSFICSKKNKKSCSKKSAGITSDGILKGFVMKNTHRQRCCPQGNADRGAFKTHFSSLPSF